MRRRIAKWVIGGVIVAVLLVATAAGAAWFAARPMAETRLSIALGRPVTIGAVSVAPSFGLTRITFEDVRLVLSGEGSIRLDRERLDLRVRSQAKRLTVAALPTDLLVTGTLRDPVVAPEIVESGIRGGIAAALGFVSVPLAVLPTIELGIGDDTRRNDTLRRSQGGRRGG